MKKHSLETLLVQWEENYSQGRDLSPSELCPEDPGLEQELRAAIEPIRLMRKLTNADPPSISSVPSMDSWATADPRMAPGQGTPAIAVPGYELQGELGRGGMGIVYKARHVELNRTVALKMILGGQHARAEDRVRFREAKTVASLKHPAIVEIYDYGTHEDRPYFVMEYCEGGSLAHVLMAGPLAPREAAQVVEQLARAMQVAHDRGVIHRDLKPGNVLLCGPVSPRPDRLSERGDHVPKISDFGLARSVGGSSGMTRTGDAVGTPSYMAPEQAEGRKDIGPSVDIYALGAILYECLTGRPPFRAASYLDTLLLVKTAEPVPPRQLNRQIPVDVETICLACLRKEPARRYASATALAEDLRRWRMGEPIAARPVGQLERFAKWARRNPAFAGLWVAVLLGAVTATAFAIQANQKAEEARLAVEREQKAREAAEHSAKEVKRVGYRSAVFFHGGKLEACRRAAEADDLTEAETLLGEIDPEMRPTWEFRHIRDLCNRKMRVVHGHETLILGLAVSPDGQHVLSADQHRLRVWDLANGELRFATAKRDGIGSWRGAVYLPNGQQFFSVTDRGRYKGWDASKGALVQAWEDDSLPGFGLAASPSNQEIVSANAKSCLTVWDTRTGKAVRQLQGHEGKVNSADWSGNGRWIVSGSDDKTVKVWDASGGPAVHTLQGPASPVCWVRFSPDSRQLLACCADRQLWMWETLTGKRVPLSEAYHGAIHACFSQDGRFLATAWNRSVKVWDRDGHKVIRHLRGHKDAVVSCVFDRAGRRVVSGSVDNTVRIWDLEAQQTATVLHRQASAVHGLAESPDGTRMLLTGSDGRIKVVDRRTGKELVVCVGHKDHVLSAVFTPDGRRVVSGGYDKTIRIWDAANGELIRLIKDAHADLIQCVACTVDGQQILSASRDRTVRLWDARTGKEVRRFEGHNEIVLALARSPKGGQFASAGADLVVKVWDLKTGKHLRDLRGHQDTVRSLAYNAAGTQLVSASQDNTLKVWDAESGQELHTLRGHVDWVQSAAFSPDGTRIVSSTIQGGLSLWDAVTGQHLLTLKGYGDEWVNQVLFSADGQCIYSAGAHGSVRVWQGPPLS